MKKPALAFLALLLLAGCAHDDLKAPCKHPSALALFATGCGPLGPINR